MLYKKRRSVGNLLLAFVLPLAALAQSTSFTTASAGNWSAFVAPNSIAAGFGVNIATTTTVAASLPLSTTLGGVSVTVTDSAGVTAQAPLYMVSTGQVNFLVPAKAALGKATVGVSGGPNTGTGSIEISNVAPAIFSANSNGEGVAAGQTITVTPSGQITTAMIYEPVTKPFSSFGYEPISVSLSPTANSVYLVLYGTGIRNHSANPVMATINGVNVPVLYAAAQPTQPGLDQINLGPLPQTLSGTGKPNLNIVVFVDGIPTNTTTISIQ